jgi:hypothetical protein
MAICCFCIGVGNLEPLRGNHGENQTCRVSKGKNRTLWEREQDLVGLISILMMIGVPLKLE